MTDDPRQNTYADREIDEMFNDITKTLGRIETQTIKTNGRVNKLERNFLIVACVVGTLLITSRSEIVSFVMSII